jgi:hypothetical protein
MSQGSRRLTGGDSRQLVRRILEQPSMVAAVESLAPQVLGRVIADLGLEDAGDIVALATTAQLAGIFDEDLWHSASPGKDEAFDADRFALWLEVMLEAGEAFAVRKLVELPEDLVTLAFHRQVLVINIEELAVRVSARAGANPSDDDVQVEKALESCLAEEIGEYRVISRRHQSWDTFWGLLVALDRDHHEFLSRLLDRLSAIDAEVIEENGGLSQVLAAAESLEADVAGDREDRRAEQGFIAPSSAAAFLALARTSKLDALANSTERDAVTRAYFRELRVEPLQSTKPPARATSAATSASDESGLVELLREAGIVDSAQTDHLLRGMSDEKAEANLNRFTLALRHLAEQAPEIHAARMRELAYLANVLAAGCSLQGRPMRSVEAARAAVATCNLGLEQLLAVKGKPGPATRMIEVTAAERLFLVGWNVLFQAVVLPAAGKASEILVRAAAGADDASGKRDLERAATALRSAVAAGRPWAARRNLEVLEERLDQPSLAALAALLGECPTLAGRLSPRENAEFGFISAQEQLGAVREFLAKLGG